MIYAIYKGGNVMSEMGRNVMGAEMNFQEIAVGKSVFEIEMIGDDKKCKSRLDFGLNECR